MTMSKTLRLCAAAAVLAAACPSGASPVSRSAEALGGLLPLSDKDMARTRESGCQSSFSHGNATLIFMIGHDFMIRTGAGLAICRISESQFGSFGEGPTAVTCGSRRLVVRRTGKVVSHEEADSAEGPARLVVTRGRSRSTVPGDWGTAC